MRKKRDFYIDGAVILLGGEADTNAAVVAAKEAFAAWATTPKEDRIAVVERILDVYNARAEDMSRAISMEMGASIDLARQQQTPSGSWHINNFIRTAKAFEFERMLHETAPNDRILYELVGVCGLTTPWNWPMNQVSLKVMPALLAGYTLVLKPSEIAPLSSIVWSEIMDEAGVPAGVYNMVNGDGADVRTQLSIHPDVAMIPFTGSTRAGVAISKAAADTLKRVSLELGGKGVNSVFADADEKAVKRGRCTASTIPASPATRRPGCWSNAPATMKPSRPPPRLQARCRSGRTRSRDGIWDR